MERTHRHTTHASDEYETVEYSEKGFKNSYRSWRITGHCIIIFSCFGPGSSVDRAAPSVHWMVALVHQGFSNEHPRSLFQWAPFPLGSLTRKSSAHFLNNIISLIDWGMPRLLAASFPENGYGARLFGRLRHKFGSMKLCPRFIEGHRWVTLVAFLERCSRGQSFSIHRESCSVDRWSAGVQL